MSEARRDLQRQTEAARLLLATYEDILGDDAEAKADAIEGETGLHEAIRMAVVRLSEILMMQEGINALAEKLEARKARLGAQSDFLRTAITVAMEVGEVRKFELDIATLSLRAVPPKVEIVNEADIPSKFWKPSDPKLDKKAILEALKEKQIVPGAVLSNGGQTVAVRFG